MLTATPRAYNLTKPENRTNLQIVLPNNDLVMYDTPLKPQFDDDGKQIPCQYVAYIRVSTDKQEHRTQLQELMRMIQNHPIEFDHLGRPTKYLEWDDVHKVEEEEGTSAWKGRRKSSLQFREEGKKLYKWIQEDSVEIVFSWRMSRLYRNSAYGLLFREQLIHEWETRTEVICCDLERGVRHPDSELYWMIKGYMNEKYSEDISNNTGDAMRGLRETGYLGTETTWGWNSWRTKELNKNTNKFRLSGEPNWDEQSIRAWGINQVENEGWSWNQVAKQLMKLGVPTKTGRTVWRGGSIKKSFTQCKQNAQLGDHPIPVRMPQYPWTNYRKEMRDKWDMN